MPLPQPHRLPPYAALTGPCHHYHHRPSPLQKSIGHRKGPGMKAGVYKRPAPPEHRVQENFEYSGGKAVVHKAVKAPWKGGQGKKDFFDNSFLMPEPAHTPRRGPRHPGRWVPARKVMSTHTRALKPRPTAAYVTSCRAMTAGPRAQQVSASGTRAISRPQAELSQGPRHVW